MSKTATKSDAPSHIVMEKHKAKTTTRRSRRSRATAPTKLQSETSLSSTKKVTRRRPRNIEKKMIEMSAKATPSPVSQKRSFNRSVAKKKLNKTRRIIQSNRKKEFSKLTHLAPFRKAIQSILSGNGESDRKKLKWSKGSVLLLRSELEKIMVELLSNSIYVTAGSGRTTTNKKDIRITRMIMDKEWDDVNELNSKQNVLSSMPIFNENEFVDAHDDSKLQKLRKAGYSSLLKMFDECMHSRNQEVVDDTQDMICPKNDSHSSSSSSGSSIRKKKKSNSTTVTNQNLPPKKRKLNKKPSDSGDESVNNLIDPPSGGEDASMTSHRDKKAKTIQTDDDYPLDDDDY